MRCDVIADGVIRATEKLNLQIPVVLRLQGTRVEEAKAMIAGSTLDIISADDLDTAARKAVKISKIVKLAREENLNVSLRNIVTVRSNPQLPLLHQESLLSTPRLLR